MLFKMHAFIANTAGFALDVVPATLILPHKGG